MGKIKSLFSKMAYHPKRILTLGTLLNVALVPIIGSFVWAMYASLARIGTEGLELQRLVGTIAYLKEVSTMSARLAVVTGDPKWEVRYWEVELDLKNSLAALAILARAEPEGNYAAKARLAYAKSIEIESLAFALVRNGLRQKAAERLFSGNFDEIEEKCSQALRDMAHTVQKSIKEEIDQFRRGIWKTGVLVFTGVAILLAAWVMVLVALKRHLHEREQSEQSVFAEKERLLVTLQSIGDGVITSDTSGKAVLINPAAEVLIGLPHEEATGKHVSELFDIVMETSGETCENPVEYVLRTGSPYQLTNSSFLSAGNQTPKYIEQSASPIRDRNNALIGVVLVIRDVTERKRLEEQLRQAAKMEAIGTLAGGIAHDFNNILYVIIGLTELSLDQALKGSPLNVNLQQVLAASNRAKALVEQILTFSRRQDPQKQVIRITPILKEVLTFLRATVPSTVEIHERIEADAETIVADPTQVQQVLMNLCTNAAHAMRENGGVLKIRLDNRSSNGNRPQCCALTESVGYLRLSVSDTGHGMTPDVLERIFEPYFTTKDKSEGTGLGLSVVHGIVKDSGGYVQVRSEVGTGSCFDVYLPLACEEASTSAHEAAQPAEGTGEHILLVDDEPLIVDMGIEMLQYLGYRVSAKCRSLDALALFAENPRQFDLVITDLTMPKMTGKELAQELRRVRPDIPIILCTGFNDLVTEEQAKDWGLAALVTKPVSVGTMAATIRSTLNVAT